MSCPLLGVCCRRAPTHHGLGPDLPHCLQIDYYCRLDCLWKKKFKKEHEEFETMENVNRLLLENVLPAHVAAHFIGDKLNEVWCRQGLGDKGGECGYGYGPGALTSGGPWLSALGDGAARQFEHQLHVQVFVGWAARVDENVFHGFCAAAFYKRDRPQAP